MSDAAKTLESWFSRMDAARISSRYLGDELYDRLARLGELAANSSRVPADDAVQETADARSVFFASALLWVLPAADLPHDINVDPDGEVAFDWDDGDQNTFAVSVSPRGVLAYAGLFGDVSVSNCVTFSGLTVPPAILDGIRRTR